MAMFKGLSLKKLAVGSDKGRKGRSSDVAVRLQTLVMKPGEYLREYVFQTYTKTTPNNKYRTTIAPINPKNPDLADGNASVSVSCSCADYKFRAETANFLKSASRIKYSNGAMPVITNPFNIAFLCKHLLACMPVVLSKNRTDAIKYKQAEDAVKLKAAKDLKTAEDLKKKKQEALEVKKEKLLKDVQRDKENKQRILDRNKKIADQKQDRIDKQNAAKAKREADRKARLNKKK